MFFHHYFFLQVQATDDDIGQNGAIIYSIYGESSNASRLFDVDMRKGYVTVKAALSKASGEYLKLAQIRMTHILHVAYNFVDFCKSLSQYNIHYSQHDHTY